MKERWRRSWYVWAWIVFEILGKKLIGDNSPVYPFFTTGVVAAFELYILLKFPCFEKLWLYEESSNNPKCTQIRWIGLLPILVASCFTRTTLWYFWIYFPLTETATLYLAGTEEEKNKVRADVFRNVKTIAVITAILIGVLVFYGYTLSKVILN